MQRNHGSLLWLAAVATVVILSAGTARAQGKGSGAAACFDRMKKLVGDWYRKDKDGKSHLTLRYRLTGAGTALEEVMAPGTAYEMVTMYHLDGNDLVATHYCAAGNQPHLKASPDSTPEKISFEFVSCSNMKSPNDVHIHRAVFTFIGPDKFTADWYGYANGKPAGPPEHFAPSRQK